MDNVSDLPTELSEDKSTYLRNKYRKWFEGLMKITDEIKDMNGEISNITNNDLKKIKLPNDLTVGKQTILEEIKTLKNALVDLTNNTYQKIHKQNKIKK